MEGWKTGRLEEGANEVVASDCRGRPPCRPVTVQNNQGCPVDSVQASKTNEEDVVTDGRTQGFAPTVGRAVDCANMSRSQARADKRAGTDDLKIIDYLESGRAALTLDRKTVDKDSINLYT